MATSERCGDPHMQTPEPTIVHSTELVSSKSHHENVSVKVRPSSLLRVFKCMVNSGIPSKTLHAFFMSTLFKCLLIFLGQYKPPNFETSLQVPYTKFESEDLL